MSGSRSTADVTSIKTQQLILQNPDGSFPPFGVVLSVTDNYGTIAPAIDISVNSLSVDHIDITGSIIQNSVISSDINSENITSDTLNVVTLLNAHDIYANTLNTTLLRSADSQSTTATTSLLTAQSGYAAHLNTTQCTTTNIDVNVANASSTTGPLAVISDMSAGTITVPYTTTKSLIANDISAAYAAIYDISSQKAFFDLLDGTDLSATTIRMNDASVLQNISAKNVIVSNNFTFQELNLTTLNAKHIYSTDISANIIRAPAAVIGNARAKTFDISNMNMSGSYTAPNIRASNFTTISMSGTTVRSDSLIIDGRATTGDISGSTIITDTNTNTTDSYITNSYSSSAIVNSINLGGGTLTYDTSQGALLVNGITTSSTSLLTPPDIFGSAYVINNLATVADISATLATVTDLFNQFLEVFNRRGIIVTLTPVPASPTFNLRSPASMGFVAANVLKGPVTFGIGTYSLYQITDALNAVSGPTITFTPQQTNGQWKVQIYVSTTTSYIADGRTGSLYSNSVPTGSLQLLAYLGFNIPDISNNTFVSYQIEPSTGLYVSSVSNQQGTRISNNFIPAVVDISNTLVTPTFDISNNDPYSVGFRLTNSGVAGTNIVSIGSSSGFGYALCPVNDLSQNIPDLTPNTAYQVSASYLDSYNRSVSNVMTWVTPRIQQPTAVILPLNIAINGFTVNLSQTYTYRTYTYKLDASGTYIPNTVTSNGPTYTYTNLLNNSPYLLQVYMVDTNYSPPSYSLPVTLQVRTLTLVAQAPTITPVPYTNTEVKIQWIPSVNGVDLQSSQILYRVGNGTTVSNSIGFSASTNISGLVGAGDISSSLMLTDGNAYNTLYSAVTTYRYDTSFGFYNLLNNATAPYVLNSTTLGLGYSFQYFTLNSGVAYTNGPYSNCTFNCITLPPGLVVSSSSVSLVASVYNIPNLTTSFNVWQPPFSASFDLSTFTPVRSSATLSLSIGTTTTSRTLTFAQTTTLSANIIVLFRITSGSGSDSIQFPTFNQRINNPLQETSATSLVYTSSPSTSLSNGFATSGNGIICQFSLI